MPSTPIYAIGDIHGNSWVLRQAYEQIRRDALEQGIARPAVVLLGDYVDRGPDSRGVLDLILRARAEFDQVELRGNHDDWFSVFLNNGIDDRKVHDEARSWTINSPETTAASYGVAAQRVDFLLDPDRARESLLAAMPRAHREFIGGLRLFHRAGNVLFVHGGIDPQRTWEDQCGDKWALTWNRSMDERESPLMDDFDPRETHGFSIVHGHFRQILPQLRPGRTNIDTSAYATSHLAVARVDPANGHVDLLPVVGLSYFKTLGGILAGAKRGRSVNDLQSQVFADRRWSPGDPVVLSEYATRTISLGLRHADPEMRAAAERCLALQDAPAQPLETAS